MVEYKPMSGAEMRTGRYVCVVHPEPAAGGCLHSPHITIKSGGVWVKDAPNAGQFSSGHRDCFEARYPWPRRPIMTRDELAKHHVEDHGRDYSQSCDGYEDMEVAERQKWSVVANWGRDGWDLGGWPYVAIYTRERAGKYELQQIVEGDHSRYEFDNEDDRTAAMDYLFLWYAADKHWAPITCDQREMLDSGYPLVIPDKWRGPCRL